ncbi:MAG: Hsp70 family protein [Spirochaetales bacterium]|nr:Hsp70 family protein [Spirochaetales bacterium]
MEKPTIGIKIADGSYYPILEEGSSSRKRLVLTTVNDNQENVQIDLYKGRGEKLLDAAYIGSLLIENITQGPKESSEIELKIGLDMDGNLNAEAGDLVSGQVESLSISMESLSDSLTYDIPEFSLDDNSGELNISGVDSEIDLDSEELNLDEDDFNFDDLSDENLEFSDSSEDSNDFEEESITEEDDYTPEFPQETEPEYAHTKRKSNHPLVVALLVLIAIAAIAAISYLIFHSLQGENAPDLEAKTEATDETVQTVSTELPSIQTEDTRVAEAEDSVLSEITTNEEPQANETASAQPPPETGNSRIPDTSGVWYKVRWGDTLWGISYSFYNSPGEYNQIVEENSIKDPDIIFAETELFIPAK